MTRIYTRGGDDGFTHARYGGRVPKTDGRPWAYGSVHEAGPALGLCRETARADPELPQMQNDLFVARLDVARATLRRLERRVVDLKLAGSLADDTVVVYLNRASDAVWAMARYADQPEPEMLNARG